MNHLKRVAVNFLILTTSLAGMGVMHKMNVEERLDNQARIQQDIKDERAEVKAEYAKADAEMKKVESAIMKKNGCTTKPRLSNHVLLRVAAEPDNVYDPYGLSMVSFDEGFKKAKAGAWVVGYCN